VTSGWIKAGIVTVLLLGAAGPGLAQDGTLAERAAAGNVDAMRAMGEALVIGSDGAAPDTAAGRAMLEAAIAAGDPAAKRVLGALLLDGAYLAPDAARGMRLLSEAAEAGDARAQTRLGIAALWGIGQEADPLRARALLDRAAASDDTEALRVLGEQLLGGWVLPRDVPTGQALLERAVALGDVEAKIALGSAWLYGTGVKKDPARALPLFESASLAGNGQGLERYGALLMWGQTDPAAAESYLRRAGQLGWGPAWSTLAEGAMYGYLGKGSRQKFAEFAEEGIRAGEERIAVLEAQRRMWGISLRASGPETIAGLEEAVSKGNAEALKFLVSLVRDGNRYNIRKSPDEAAGYLARSARLLTRDEVIQLSFTIRAARTRQEQDFVGLASDYEAPGMPKSVWFGKELYAANPNLAIYLLQKRMRAEGLHDRPPTGLATQGTLRALAKACATLPDPTPCSDSVMHPDVIGQLLAR
jgi:uncharacterized protein